METVLCSTTPGPWARKTQVTSSDFNSWNLEQLGLEDFSPWSLTHLSGTWAGTSKGWSLLQLLTGTPTHGLLTWFKICTAWWLSSERENPKMGLPEGEKQVEVSRPFLMASEIIQHHWCCHEVSPKFKETRFRVYLLMVQWQGYTAGEHEGWERLLGPSLKNTICQQPFLIIIDISPL